MLFGEGLSMAGMFATHPPLPERIRLLEASFNAEQLQQSSARRLTSPPQGAQEDLAMGLAGSAPPPLPPRVGQFNVTPPRVVAQVGAPAQDDYRRAGSLMESLSPELRTQATQRDGVMPLLPGLLVDDDATIASKQRIEVVARLGEAVADRAWSLRTRHLSRLHPMLRLPPSALAFPVLRRRPRPELEEFLSTVHATVHAEGKVSLFECCVAKLLEVKVREALDPARHARFGRRKPGRIKQEFATLLAVVAHTGNDNPTAAQHAYLSGLQRVLPRDHLPYAPPAAACWRWRAPGQGWTRWIRWPSRCWWKRSPPPSATTGASACPSPNCCARSAACRTVRCRRCWNTPEGLPLPLSIVRVRAGNIHTKALAGAG